MREVRLHDGRHTAATLLLSEGVHPQVMETLGHARMRTTSDTYSHLPAPAEDAAERMGRTLWAEYGRCHPWRTWQPERHHKRRRALS